MRILLVNSNRMKPPVAPIGLDYVADGLRAAGHEISLLDLCFSTDVEGDIASAVRSFGPRLVGMTVRNTDDCYFASGAYFIPGVREMVDAVRRCTDAPVALGGVGFSVSPEAALEACGADFGIAGEGEEAFPMLADALGNGRKLAGVPGLLYWEGGRFLRSPPAEAALDRMAPRSRSLLDNRRYFREGGQGGFETRRGCPMGCIYCADPVSKGRAVRTVPAGRVVGELRALLELGIDHLHSCDSEMNVPAGHAREVCRAAVEAGLGGRLRWYAYCAIAPFDAETAHLFRRAGCAGIDFGADSGSAEMLRGLGRDFAPADLAETARHCRSAGIPFMYDLLVGGPGETRETVRESIDLVRRIGPDCVGVSLGVRVWNGTPLAALIRRQGPFDGNPALHGATRDNDRLLRPLFYVSPGLGSDAASIVRELVGGDERFFLPSGPDEKRDYNYNDNDLLVRAIAGGARGAYWDILRRMREGSP